MKEILILDPAVAAGHRYHVSGTLEDWRGSVGRLCHGNTRLMLAVSAAFAGPLLYLLKSPNVGIHLRGISSIGKTTALYAAGSVWGGGGGDDNNAGFVQSWRATANGLELQCALHNDAILCLDEISLVNEREIGDIVYCLGNGIGKRRATRDIKSRPVIQFRLVFLSCGERSLREIMSGAGKQARGGQESRLIDIQADACRGQGIFERLHEHPNGATLSQCISQLSKQFYGSPSRAFVKYLVENFEQASAEAKKLRDEFIRDLRLEEHHASGEVYRIANALGVIAAAGEMATAQGITGWREGDAMSSVRICFDSWCYERGGSYAAQDIQLGIQAVAAFLARYPGRFQAIDGPFPVNQHDRAGFFEEEMRDPDEDEDINTPVKIRRYYIDREIFKNEICRGYDYHLVLNNLHAHGHLVTEKGQKHLSVRKRIPNEGRNRFFCVLSTIHEINDFSD